MDNLPNIKQDFSAWYQDIVYRAELVDQSPVRGAFVIRPYGYALWEEISDILDKRIKATGHQNASFPLFIPESFLKREASHVEGFAPEVAVVTHAGGHKLEEPLIVRPTSETIIHHMFARWLKSWRDLPIKVNQWANVIRWEMRPRAFLRTTEFFWQEGHTAHETREEAAAEVAMMLREYVDLALNYLAIPVITGMKSPTEKFPGAEETHTFEAVMQDGKALQMGTSHLLSQSFCHAFNMRYQARDGQMQFPFLTSWGATTRLVGAVIMTHGDQKGLIMPPRVAPIQVIIIPILHKKIDSEPLLMVVNALKSSLLSMGVRVKVDDDDHKSPGNKFFYWEMKGVPIRVEIGHRDLEVQQLTLVARTQEQKHQISIAQAPTTIIQMLDDIQAHLLAQAQERLKSMTLSGEKLAVFGPLLEKDGGLYKTGWCGDSACEGELKRFKASSRCMVPGGQFTHCFHCDRISTQDIFVAKGY